jgi:oligopeptidase B
MLSYSPYDQISPEKEYPPILLTAGLHDPRVAYWEPLKYAAKLREVGKGDSKVILKVDMSAGHFSASDRYKYLKEYAYEMSFVLHEIGATELRLPSTTE